MKLSNFPYLSENILTIQATDSPKQLVKNQEIKLFLEGENWYISQSDTLIRVVFDQDSNLIESLGKREETLWLLMNIKNNDLSLQFVSFIESVELDLEIGVTEKIAEQLSDKKEINEANIEDACDWFKKQFLLENNGNEYRLVIAYFKNTTDKQFLAIGNQWQAYISRDNNHLIIQRLTRIKSEQSNLSLITGKIEFYNAGVEQRLLDPNQQARLNTSLRDNGNYLELWKHYNDLQWAKATQDASELGVLKFIRGEAIDGDKLSWEFFVKSSEKLSDFKEKWRSLGLSDTQVEVTPEQPDWLTSEISEATDQPTSNEIFRGTVSFGGSGNSIVITPDAMRRSRTPPQKGYIAYSLAGERIVKRRREQAKEDIDSGKRLPQLTYLLQGLDVPSIKYKKLKALTPYARETFNGGEPTSRQKDALVVALNTSDIALIIGPPGTGKTQVIAALQRRLAEENPNQDVQHQVLVSSYQHDAVDNALNRSDVYGLPAIRVGGRNNKKNESKPITFWCDKRQKNIALELEKKKKEEPHVALLEQIDSVFFELKLASLSLSARMRKFEQINTLLLELDALQIRLPSRVKDDWSSFYKNSSQERQQQLEAPVDKKLLKKIRALRVTPSSFLDDGMDRVYDLYSMLKRKNLLPNGEDGKFIKKLCDQERISNEESNRLCVIKNNLLDRFIPDYRPPEIKNRLSKEEIGLINSIENALHGTLANSRKGIASVLGRYHDALALSPKQAERAVENYSAIVGATCQQAASKPMSVLQSLSDLDAQTEIEFESVIVDEAARANPLDLFVPMAMAKRRIVLVGDDRQLPHLLEPELEEELAEQESLTAVQREAYKQSLFERLRRQLLEIEKDTGVRRVVMLDTQFRMHPILGDFISKNFYENEGLDILKSGRPPEDFVHHIDRYDNKVCAWLNVPLRDGAESRPKYSPMRQIEAEKIALETKKILESTDNSVSVGVITFYSAQVDAIKNEMEKLGLIEQGEIIPEYLYTNDGEERLRVGTVDAFQGKEFDVVLLSIVRANTVKIPSNGIGQEQKERLLNRKYGHLRLSNRMNVAMSRQRKLLIAVGALEMAETEEATNAVPALSNFLSLCRGGNGRVF